MHETERSSAEKARNALAQQQRSSRTTRGRHQLRRCFRDEKVPVAYP